jgi:hypothetical protein
MKVLRSLVVVILAGLVGSAPATLPMTAGAVAQSRPARDCFNARMAGGFRSVGREAVDVRISRNREYRLVLAGYCPNIEWSLGIALRTYGGASFVCAGSDAMLLVPGPTGVERCAVWEVRRLSQAEIEAERARRR